jgi:hypothetical protein
MRFISIDAESNGLAGKAFAVGLTFNDGPEEIDIALIRCPIEDEVDPWVESNVLPNIPDISINARDYLHLLDLTWKAISAWGGKNVQMIAHVAWPVEARLLLDVYPGDQIWNGPYPLIDVSSVLLAKGFDRNATLSVDRYNEENNLEKPPGSPHHPLYDARAASTCYAHVMGWR